MYLHIRPNRTIRSVAMPDVVVRKFSPCGRFLVCFSIDGVRWWASLRRVGREERVRDS